MSSSKKKKSQIKLFSRSHTDAHNRLDDISIHHKPHFHQITSFFKPSHRMVRSTEKRFAMERMAIRSFGAKKIATALDVTTKRWLRRTWLRRLKACVAAKSFFFLNGDRETSHRAAQRHTGKTRHQRVIPHSMAHFSAPQRQPTRGKTYCFVAHIPNRNFDSPQPQNGPRVPNAQFPSFCVFSLEDTVQKMREPKFPKNMNFCEMHFSSGEKQISETRCIKQHAFWVSPLRDL